MIHGNTIVGGSPRTGKTTLIKLINENNLQHAGLPVEGLLRTYINKKYLFFKLRKKLILKDYLKRPRNISVDKTLTARPIDYYNRTLTQILNGIPKDIKDTLPLINYCLEIYAKESRKKYWAVCDTHPEFIFEKMKGTLPELKLIYLIRDPREVICAGLYWRNFPKRSHGKPDRLKYRLLLWLLSVNCINKLSKKYPDDISVIYFNNNIEHLLSTVSESNYSNYLMNYFKDQKPYFTYKKGKYYTSDGTWIELLNDDEIKFIENFSFQFLKINKPNNIALNTDYISFSIVFVLSKILSNISYNTSKKFVDLIYTFNLKKRTLLILNSIFKLIKDLNTIRNNKLVKTI